MVNVPASRVILMRQGGASEQVLPSVEYPGGTPTPTPAPTVAGIALSGSTGKVGNYLNAGDVVRVTATFSAAVNVTGTPQATITVGSTARAASYESGSGTTGLVFAYTIQAGETDADGISIPVNAIALNGGTIKSAGGTDATLASSAVAANGAYLVDTSAPSAPTINVVAGNDVINASEVLSPISGTAQAGAIMAITIGVNVRGAVADGSGIWSYTPVAGEMVAWGQGAKSLAVTAADAAGNVSPSTTRAITIDTVAPTITSVALSGAGATNDFLNVGDTATATVTLDSVVTVTGTPQMALNVGSVTRQANYLSGSGSNVLLLRYSIQSGDTDANGISIGANSLALNGGTIVDAAGNPATLTHGALSDNGSWKVDTTAPTTPTVALGTGVADGATHAEATAGTGVITVSAEAGSAISAVFTRGGATVTKSATGTGAALAIVLTEGDLTTLGDGTISVSVTATDPAGNVSGAATTSFVLEGEVIEPPVLTFDGTTFTSDKSAQFKVGGTNVGASNATTLTYNEGTMLGQWVGADNGALSNVIVVEAGPADIFNIDFSTETDGGLDGRYGIAANASYQIAGDVLQVSSNSAQFRANLGVNEAIVEFEPIFRVGSNGNDSNSTKRGFQFAAGASGDPGIYINIRGGSLLFDKNTTAGSWQTFATTISGLVFDNKKVKYRYHRPGGVPHVQVFLDDVRVDGGGTDGLNVNATGSPVPAATYLVFEGPDSTGTANPSYPIKVLKTLKVRENYNAPITILSQALIEEIVDGVLTRYIRITGTADAGALNDAVFFYRDADTGELLKDWTAVDGAPGAPGGAFTLDLTPLTAAHTGRSLENFISDATTRSLTTHITSVVPAFQTVFPYVQAIHEGGVSYYDAAYRERNAFKQTPMRIAMPSGLSSMDAEDSGYDPATGRVYHWPPTALENKTSLNFPISMPAGTWTINYPPTMTPAFRLEPTSGVTVTVAASGGTAEIVTDGNLDGTGWFDVSGAIPVEGVSTGDAGNLTCLPKADPHPERLLSEPFRDHMTDAGYKGMRIMGTTGGEDMAGSRVDSVVPVSGPNLSAPLAPAVWGEISRLNGGISPYLNIRSLATDAFVTGYFTALKASLLSTVSIRFSVDNERWNGVLPFILAMIDGSYYGAKRGVYGDGFQAPLPALMDFRTKFNRSTGVISEAVASGGQIFVNWPGWESPGAPGLAVYQANNNRPSGDVLPTASNANWTIIVNDADLVKANKHDYVCRVREMGELARAAFGADANRIIPMFEWAIVDPNGIEELLSWNGFGLWLASVGGAVADAPYWGHDLLRASPHGDRPGWGATEKARYLTDPEQFKDDFFAIAPTVVDEIIAKAEEVKHRVGRWCVANGLPVDAIPLASYECGHHLEVRESEWTSAIIPIFNDIIKDARMAALHTRFVRGLKQRVGGYHNHFLRMTREPAGFTNGYMRNWGYAGGEGDTGPDNLRLIALNAEA